MQRITIKQLLFVGIAILVGLAVAPALHMVSSLKSIEAANAVVQQEALPLSKTVASLQSALQELDNTQLRYLAESDDKPARIKEISAGFRRLNILVAKMRYGSNSEEYKAERARFAGELADDAVTLPVGNLSDQDKSFADLAARLKEAESGFAVLMAAHQDEISYIVALDKERRTVSSLAADIFIDFRAWVYRLEQAVQYNVNFSRNTDVKKSLIGRLNAIYISSDGETDQFLRDAESILGKIMELAQAINAANAEEKVQLLKERGATEFKQFDNTISNLVAHTTKMVNASRNEVQSSLQRFQTIGAEVFRLTSEIESAAAKATELKLGTAQRALESTASLTWIALGCIAALAPLFGILLGFAILRPLRQIANVTESVSQGQAGIAIAGTKRRDEIGRIARALVVFQENIAETQRLRAEQTERDLRNARAKSEDMARLAAKFEASVLKVVEVVAGSSASMRERAAEFSAAARTTSEQATGVAATSNQTSVSVRSVAVATEELSASVRNITEQTDEALRLSDEANRKADESVAIMSSLDSTVRQIGDVVGVINQIASQTNLLALNATIEAARAGEAGRGFAVVANEVKALAAQTARATEEISLKIKLVQEAADEAVDSIGQIGAAIPQISAASSAISNAMNQQDKATREIAGNVDQAALGVEEVTRVISCVAEVASGNGAAAAQMFEAVEGLLAQSQILREEVEGFLGGIRAA